MAFPLADQDDDPPRAEYDKYGVFESIDREILTLRERGQEFLMSELQRRGMLEGFHEAARELFPPLPDMKKRGPLGEPYLADMEQLALEMNDREESFEDQEQRLQTLARERERSSGTPFGTHVYEGFDALTPDQSWGCLALPIALVASVTGGGSWGKKEAYKKALSNMREAEDMEEPGEVKDNMKKAILYLEAAAEVMRASEPITSAEAVAKAQAHGIQR